MEEFEWVNELEKTDKEAHDNETYFSFVNENRTTAVKGSQAWNCYGQRRNLHLLINYGFCFQDNLYDSLELNLNLNFELVKKEI